MKNKKYDAFNITIEVGEQFKNLSSLYDYLGEDYHDSISPSDFVGVFYDEDFYKVLCDFAGDEIENSDWSDCYVLDVLNNYAKINGYDFDFAIWDENNREWLIDCSVLPDGKVVITDIK